MYCCSSSSVASRVGDFSRFILAMGLLGEIGVLFGVRMRVRRGENVLAAVMGPKKI